MVLRYHPKNADLLYAGTAEGVVYVYNIKTGSEVDKIPGELISLSFWGWGVGDNVTAFEDVSISASLHVTNIKECVLTVRL